MRKKSHTALLSSSNISDEDVKKFRKECKEATDQYVAKGLILSVHGWILANNVPKILEISKKMEKNPILSDNSELMKRIHSGGLSEKDIPYLNELKDSFSS